MGKSVKKLLIVLVFVGVLSIFFLGLSLSGMFIQGTGNSVVWKGLVLPLGYEDTFQDYYITINDVPSVMPMNVAFQIKNQEDRDYYFLIESYGSPPSGWNINKEYIGNIAMDGTKNFAYAISRNNPGSISDGEMTETINLIVKAYRDSGYTDLYSQDDFEVTFHFIDRESSAWTIEEVNDFDDGTTQGWGHHTCGSGLVAYPERFGASNDFYISFPYSLKMINSLPRGYIKTFNVVEGEKTYLIFSLRSTQGNFPNNILINNKKYFNQDISIPANKWHQFTIPLFPGENEIKMECLIGRGTSYLDSVYVISK